MCKTVGKYYENGKYFLEYVVSLALNISRIDALK